jgi:hypothetical protein
MTADSGGHGCPYGEHTDVVKGIAAATAVMETVKNEIATICRQFEVHIGLEGHPLMAQRVKQLEDGHARQIVVLDQLTVSNREISASLKTMQTEQQARAEERRLEFERQSQRFEAANKKQLSWIGLAGVLGAALITALSAIVKAMGGH